MPVVEETDPNIVNQLNGAWRNAPGTPIQQSPQSSGPVESGPPPGTPGGGEDTSTWSYWLKNNLLPDIGSGLAQDVASEDPSKSNTNWIVGGPLFSQTARNYVPGVSALQDKVYQYGQRTGGTADTLVKTAANIAPAFAAPEAKLPGIARGVAGMLGRPLAKRAVEAAAREGGGLAEQMAAAQTAGRKANKIGGTTERVAGRALSGAAGGAMQPGDRGQNAILGAASAGLLGPMNKMKAAGKEGWFSPLSWWASEQLGAHLGLPWYLLYGALHRLKPEERIATMMRIFSHAPAGAIGATAAQAAGPTARTLMQGGLQGGSASNTSKLPDVSLGEVIESAGRK